jgi:hypothetical protein
MVIVGTVETERWIIHPEKCAGSSKPLPDGRFLEDLPSPHNYLAGHLFRVQVESAIKPDKEPGEGETINAFVAGYLPTEGAPVLFVGKKYLLFLSPLKADPVAFSGTVISKPGVCTDSSAPLPQFDPQSASVVVRGDAGLVLVSPDTLKDIDAVRSAVFAAREHDRR